MAEPLKRVSLQTKLTLHTMMRNPEREWYGFELSKRLSIKQGSLYPILNRLEKAGWLEYRAEESSDSNRQAKKYYCLTEQGVILAEQVLKKSSALPLVTPEKTSRTDVVTVDDQGGMTFDWTYHLDQQRELNIPLVGKSFTGKDSDLELQKVLVNGADKINEVEFGATKKILGEADEPAEVWKLLCIPLPNGWNKVQVKFYMPELFLPDSQPGGVLIEQSEFLTDQQYLKIKSKSKDRKLQLVEEPGSLEVLHGPMHLQDREERKRVVSSLQDKAGVISWKPGKLSLRTQYRIWFWVA